MSLEKKIILDKVEFVGEFRTMQVREKTIVLESGNLISDSFHRSSYECDFGIENLPEELQPYAQGVWTDDLLAEYEVSKNQTLAENQQSEEEETQSE